MATAAVTAAAVRPIDRMRLRLVALSVKRIREHLEAMQRDAHGIEYQPWKDEVDHIWKSVFERINEMEPDLQREALELIRELWTLYISHYAVMGER